MKMRIFVYVLLGLIALAVLGMRLPAISYAREPARRNMCRMNLGSIGQACRMYADDHNGSFPPDFQALVPTKYLDAFKCYVCASTNHQPATSAGDLASPEHCDYLYFGQGLVQQNVSNPAVTVVACDRTGNHKQFWNILLVDGRVMGYSGADFGAVVRANHLILSAESAAK